eukprot:SAG31_NODE_1576_length_7838_cov_5.738468_8_plen_105_part_00
MQIKAAFEKSRNLIFDDLDDEDTYTIMCKMALQKVPDGTAVVKQGQVGESYYGISSGECEVLINDKKVRSYFLVFVPTIREIRDFYREMQRTNRESITVCRLRR